MGRLPVVGASPCRIELLCVLHGKELRYYTPRTVKQLPGTKSFPIQPGNAREGEDRTNSTDKPNSFDYYLDHRWRKHQRVIYLLCVDRSRVHAVHHLVCVEVE
jgi:hypothetical protein